MKSLTLEYIIMACILGMFVRDMAIELKSKKLQRTEVESINVKEWKDEKRTKEVTEWQS